MKKSRVLGIITLVIFAIILVMGYFMFRTENYGTSLPKNFPKDVPVISGDVVSCRALRSDDLVRVIDLRIKTKQSFGDVVEFYKAEFKKNATKELSQPNFTVINPSGGEASGMAEFGKNQVVVSIKSSGEDTEVWIQVRGDSILFLPR